jgi:polyisoprenoid-binding protein YceI
MRFDAGSADCRLFTYKEGPLSPFGHDLELRVSRFTIEVSEDRAQVEGVFEAGSLQLVGASVDGRVHAMSERDRQSIEATLAGEILQASRHPQIRFRSSAISPVEIRGTLTLLGRSRELTCRRAREGGRETASVNLHQPDFGITPYRAMLGALRVRADVLVRISLPITLPPG